ncbi:MAG: bacterial Ig-like domain-containing protein, partial [Acholeplasmatales bacterium]|nr:bacterial Ig-like domain-containing protein [Acholeplasmatales bacterium]
TNAKTDFYLGDEFTSEGIVVKATYSRPINSEETEEKVVICDRYTVNIDRVRMNETGRYTVQVTYRDGIEKTSTTYYINVRSSFLPLSGVEYLAGIESSVKRVEVKQGEKFVLPTTTITASYMTGEEVTRTSTVPTAALTIDSASVDTNKKGTYTVTYTLKSKVTINGVEHEISESTFIIVDVINAVQAISFEEGTLSQPASVKGLNFSDWKFRLNLEIGEDMVIPYDEETFTIEGVNTLVSGSYNATVTYMDSDQKIKTNLNVTITEPENEAIIQLLSFGDTAKGITSRTRFGEGYYFYGGPNTDVEVKSKEADGLSFNTRFKLNGAGSTSNRFFEVYMPNAGTIVLYYETSSVGTERILNFMDASGSVIDQYATATSPAKAVIDVNEGGTYYFASQSGGMNIWGCIIAYDLEGAVEPTPSAVNGLAIEEGYVAKFVQNGSTAGLDSWKFIASYDDNTTEILDRTSSKITIGDLDLTTVGNKQVKVTFDDGHSTKDIMVDYVVTDVTLSSLEFVSGSTTQRSTYGTYDVSDFVLKANYSDNSSVNLTSASAGLTFEVDALTIGTKDMVISYVDEALQSASTTISVTTIPMSSSNMILNPTLVDRDLFKTTTGDPVYNNLNGFIVPSANDETTGSKNALIEDNKKTINGLDFNTRLSLKTLGNKDHNSIKFTTTAPAKLVIYGSSSQDLGKYIFVSKDASTVYNDYKVLATKTNQVFEFALPEAGDYYILADNAAYIFLVAVEYNQKATSSTATATSMSVYSPILVDGVTTVDKTNEPENVFEDFYFQVKYNDNSYAFVSSSQVTINSNINSSVEGEYNVTATYNGITTTFKVVVAVEA